MKNTPKVLFLDIENSPSLGWTWKKWETDILQFQQEWYMMSFAYKWDGKATKVRALPDYKLYKKEPTNDRALVEELWEIMDESEIIIGHNLDRFDIRKINTRFLYHGFSLPSDYKTVDTLKVARKMFLMNSNKLDHLAQYLDIGEKVSTGGFDLWLDCMAGKASAWRRMKSYNKHDVDLTEKLYKKLLPYVQNHPNYNVFKNTSHNCPNCGSSHTHSRGYTVTRVNKRRRLQCTDCGAWSKGEIIKTNATAR